MQQQQGATENQISSDFLVVGRVCVYVCVVGLKLCSVCLLVCKKTGKVFVCVSLSVCCMHERRCVHVYFFVCMCVCLRKHMFVYFPLRGKYAF